MEKYWLTIVIILLIVVIIFDGVRRMRRARRDSIKMSLRSIKRHENFSGDSDYGSEFPTGGARPSTRKIDPQRIQEARSKYDFGEDLPKWGSNLGKKVSRTIDKFSDDVAKQKPEDRIEPSSDEIADPLMDKLESRENSHHPETDIAHAADQIDLTADDNGVDAQDENQQLPVDSDQEAYNEKEKSDKKSAAPGKNNAPQISDESSHIQEKVDSEKVRQKFAKNTALDHNVASQAPEQPSLNLEDSVPMLMDTFNESGVSEAESENVSKQTETGVKINSTVHTDSSVQSRHTEKSKTTVFPTNKPLREAGDPDQKSSSIKHQATDVLAIHVKAAENSLFYGRDLLGLILENGLRYGDMNIFHRHADEDGEGPVLFSMANMVKPGTFDLRTFEEFSTVGLSFFLTLPTASGDHMQAFDAMLSTAQNIADALSGELKDEQRSVLTKQTIEHYRERIRDFSRRQQLEKSK